MARKDKFLKSLTIYLEKNNIKNQTDIILKYEKIIEERIKNKEGIKNIIESFGTFEDIVKKEKINSKKQFIEKLNYIFKFIKTLLKTFFSKIKNQISKIKNYKEQDPDEIKKEVKRNTILDQTLFITYKIILYILIIIFSLLLIWISTVFVASLFMYLDGVKLIGLNLLVLSLMIFVVWLLFILNKIATNRKIYFRKNLIYFICMLVFIGVSFGISIVQYYKIDFINDITDKYIFNSIEKTYKLPKDNQKYYIYFNSWYKNKYIINYDNSLDNQIIIKVNYYECLYDVYLKNKSDSLYISLKKDYRDLVSIYIENLKDNKIYDTKELSRNIVNIYINEKDYERLVIID